MVATAAIPEVSSAPVAAVNRTSRKPPPDEDPPIGGTPIPAPKPPPNGSPSVANRRDPLPKSPELQGFGSRVTDYSYRYYDPATGRWLNRDPLWRIEKQDRNTENAETLLSLIGEKNRLPILENTSQSKPSSILDLKSMCNPYLFVNNWPTDIHDLIGLESQLPPGLGGFYLRQVGLGLVAAAADTYFKKEACNKLQDRIANVLNAKCGDGTIIEAKLVVDRLRGVVEKPFVQPLTNSPIELWTIFWLDCTCECQWETKWRPTTPAKF